MKQDSSSRAPYDSKLGLWDELYPLLNRINEIMEGLEFPMPTDLTIPFGKGKLRIVYEQPVAVAEQPCKAPRNIDIEALKHYFNARFLGIGNNVGLFEPFVEALGRLTSAKSAAKVALMVYRSDVMNNSKPSSFAEWYRRFCALTGFEWVGGYKPSCLKPDATLKRQFYML